MLIVGLKYIKPKEVLNQYRPQHRAFLQAGFEQGFFLAAGPKKPEGGLIIALVSREKMEELIVQDPYYTHQLAEFHMTEFDPVLACSEIKSLI